MEDLSPKDQVVGQDDPTATAQKQVHGNQELNNNKAVPQSKSKSSAKEEPEKEDQEDPALPDEKRVADDQVEQC